MANPFSQAAGFQGGVNLGADMLLPNEDPWRTLTTPQLQTENIQPGPQPGVPYSQPSAADAGFNPNWSRAMAQIESSGNYGAVTDASNGRTVYGAHQVLGENVGPWTQRWTGRRMTPQEFLASPDAQEAVFQGQFGEYVRQFGSPGRAVQAWLAGPGGVGTNRADRFGTTPSAHETRFMAALAQIERGGGQPMTVGSAGAPSAPLGAPGAPVGPPPGVGRTGWLGAMDVLGGELGLGPKVASVRDFQTFQNVNQQRAANAIQQRMVELAREHPTYAAQHLADAMWQDPVFGRNAIALGSNVTSVVMDAAKALRPAPSQQVVAPGASLVQTDPRTHAVNPVFTAPNRVPQEGFTLSPGQTRFGPDGRPIANVPEADPNRGPIAQQRANLLGTAAARAEPAAKLVTGLEALQGISDRWGQINGDASLMNQFRVFASQYAPGLAVRGAGTAQEFQAVVSAMIAALPRTPGAVSDFETRQLVAQLPSLAADQKGRNEIITRLMNIARVSEVEARMATAAMNGQIPIPDALEFLGAPRDLQTITHFQFEHPNVRIDDIFRMNTAELSELRNQIVNAYGSPERVPSPLRKLLEARFNILRRRDQQ